MFFAEYKTKIFAHTCVHQSKLKGIGKFYSTSILMFQCTTMSTSVNRHMKCLVSNGTVVLRPGGEVKKQFGIKNVDEGKITTV